MGSYGTSAANTNMGIDLVEMDRKVREMWASRWLAPAVTAGSLPRVPQMATLPTAQIAYEGRLVYVPYAGGTAGKFYICLLAADGTTWNWQQCDNTSAADLSGNNFLVGTANASLPSAIVAGATPAGELAGTWASPTVATTHSGSKHAWALRGFNTVEVTTASTSAVDLLTISSLSIPVTNGVIIEGVARKSAGGSWAALGLKVNSTVTVEAANGSGSVWLANTVNQAQDGAFRVEITPRSANYLHGGFSSWLNSVATTFNAMGSITSTAAMPNATITSLTLRGISGFATTTLGVQEVAIYEVLYS